MWNILLTLISELNKYGILLKVIDRKVSVKETFYVCISVDDSTKDKVYYLPMEFPKLLIDNEKYYEFLPALFYTDNIPIHIW